ncbi:hypothetical protein [Phytomonospora endophytica]|uniref:Tetratricopeptide repeat protein n=1 Tax=Phytomonospora endophytica TaxID=714109 RepID=A0A841FJX6_9ACTN|nr:hypothetical protein [Phytomonospora endophytica]MBB6035243.1 hypothetical protein [Phytomonospora endophytica]GIG64008.1 hypothetical protein Pen01_03030 [Phytomonospora endophytica]
MRRRRLLLGLTLAPLAGLSPGVDLRALADELTRRDLAHGGAAVAAEARSAATWVLTRSARGDDAAVILDRTAWALRDTGAAAAHDLLARAETVAEDPWLRTHIRLDRALAHDDAGDHAAALRELTGALTGPVAPLQRGGLHAAAARCAERAGDTRAAVAHLKAAEGLHETADHTDVPDWAAAVLGDPGQLPGAIGRGWLTAGRYRDAEAWLTRADEAYAPGRARGRANGLVRRAHARLASGDLAGCDADLAAAGDAPVRSARLAAGLERVRRLRTSRR